MTADEELKALKAHIVKLHKDIRKQGLWLGAGMVLILPYTDEAQEGPLVKKLWKLAGVK